MSCSCQACQLGAPSAPTRRKDEKEQKSQETARGFAVTASLGLIGIQNSLQTRLRTGATQLAVLGGLEGTSVPSAAL